MKESPTRQFCLEGLDPVVQWASYFPPQLRHGSERFICEKSRGEGSRREGGIGGIPAVGHE